MPGLIVGGHRTQIYTISPDDGSSAVARFDSAQSLERGGWSVSIATATEVRRDGHAFVLTSEMTGMEDGATVFRRRWEHRFADADGAAGPVLSRLP